MNSLLDLLLYLDDYFRCPRPKQKLMAVKLSKTSAESIAVTVVLAIFGVVLYFSTMFFLIGILYRRRVRDRPRQISESRTANLDHELNSQSNPWAVRQSSINQRFPRVRYGDVNRPPQVPEYHHCIVQENVGRNGTGQGPNEKQISLSQASSTTNTICAICLDDLQCNHYIRVLPCQHIFHSSCIDSWFSRCHMECPVCKADPLNAGNPASLGDELLPPYTAGSLMVPEGAHVRDNGRFVG